MVFNGQESAVTSPLEPAKVCIIGSGCLGLAAAYKLSQHSGVEVTVFESGKTLGGLAAPHKLVNGEKLETYYHYLFKKDEAFLNLAKQIGVFDDIRFGSGSTGHYYVKKLYDISDVASILKTNLLSPINRWRFLLASAYLKAGVQKYFKNENAFEGSVRLFGKEISEKIWHPLLRGKFADHHEQVPMSWLASRIRDRSLELGYFENGFHLFYERLEQYCKKQGVIFKLNTPARSLQASGNGVKVNGEEFRACLSTIGPQKETEFLGLPRIATSQAVGAICVIYEVRDNPGLPFWTNYCDSESPVVAVINHRELDRSSRFAEIYPVYSASYLKQSSPIFQLEDEEIRRMFFQPILEIAKASSLSDRESHGLEERCIRSTVYRTSYAQPVINPDIGLPPLASMEGPVYRASMHSIYPHDRGQNYGILWGQNMAQSILSDLSIPATGEGSPTKKQERLEPFNK